MPSRTPTLSPAAADVLRAATATDTAVTLPPGQLDRKVYEEVNKALTRIGGGGKWNRRQGAHLFPRDPRPELAALVDDGRMPVDRDKELSFFRTPQDIAEQIAHELADIEEGGRVLEPSAGDGAILLDVAAARPDLVLHAVEVDEHRHAQLVGWFQDHPAFSSHCGRFQDFAAADLGGYDAVVMNPPFTEPGDAKAWATHLEAAWSLVGAGGLLLAIVPSSLAHGRDRRTVAVRDLVRAHGGWCELPEDAFRESGTLVRTLLVSMTKPDLDDELAGLTTGGIGVDFSSSKRPPTATNPHPEELPVTVTDDRPTTTDAQRDDYDRILHLDPSGLIIAANVRLDPRLDRGFLDSIKARGVGEVISAYYGPDGSLSVLKGQRRTLAAVQVGRPTVPVRIVAPPAADTDRIIDQLAENERRTAMGLGETALAYEQLEIGGLSAAAIARQTGTKKDDVYRRLTVAKSELARRAGDKYALDLVQAATVAEFESDPDTVKALIAAAKSGQFEHVAQRARDERAMREQRVTLAAELAAAGIAVVDRPAHGDTETYLSHLQMTPAEIEAHTACDGHAVALVDVMAAGGGREWKTSPVCVDPAANGHRVPVRTSGPSGERPTGPLSDAEKAARKLLISRNKEWASATTVRREFITSLAKRKTVPAGAETFVLRQLLDGRPWMRRAMETKHALLTELTGGVDAVATSKRATVLALAVVLAAWEDQTARGDWRSLDDHDRAIFAVLVGWGYGLSDVERIAVEGEPAGTPVVEDASPEEGARPALSVVPEIEDAPADDVDAGELVADVDDDGLTAEERAILAADLAAQGVAGEESQEEVTAGE